jgi:hypothetical protein
MTLGSASELEVCRTRYELYDVSRNIKLQCIKMLNKHIWNCSAMCVCMSVFLSVNKGSQYVQTSLKHAELFMVLLRLKEFISLHCPKQLL